MSHNPCVRRVVIAALLIFTGACEFGEGTGAGGCARVHQGDYDFPVKRIVRDAVVTRLTQGGSDLLVERVRDLVLQRFGADETGWATIPLESLGLGAFEGALGPLEGGFRDLVLTLDLRDLEVILLPDTDPARLRIRVDDAVMGLADGVVAGELDTVLLDGDVACRLGNGSADSVTRLSFDLLLELGTAADGTLEVEVIDFSVVVDSFDITVGIDCSLPECLDGLTPPAEQQCSECKAVCGAADLLADVAELLRDSLEELTNTLITLLADDIANLLIDALLNGRPVAVEGTIALGRLLGPVLPFMSSVAPLGVLARPAGEAFQVSGGPLERGLDVVLDAGVALVDRAHPCVVDTEALPTFESAPIPSLPALAPAPDGTSVSYHLGVGLSDALVNEGLWALWRAGALCVDLSSADLANISGGKVQLDAGVMALMMPGLASLVGPEAPIRVTIRPQLRADQGPVLRFSGSSSAPSIHLVIDQATVGIDAWFGGDFIRVLGVQTKVAMGFSVALLPDARISLQLIDLEVGELVLTDNELFPAARLDLIIPFALDLVMGLLADMPLKLDLSTAGLALTLGDEEVSGRLVSVGSDGSWLTTFWTLETQPRERMTKSHQPVRMLTLRETTPGQITVATELAPGHALQLRVSGGAWSPWFSGLGEHVVRHPRLWLLGSHSVEARVRRPDGTIGPTHDAFEAIVVMPVTGEEANENMARNARASSHLASLASDTGCSAGGALGLGSVALLLALFVGIGWSRHRGFLALLLLSCLGGAACESPAQPPLACEFHDQCPDDWLCAPQGLCVVATPCVADENCCPGSTCFNGWCRPSSECGVDRACDDAAQACEQGQCVASSCGVEGSCPMGLICVADRCVKEPACGGCAVGEACHLASGRCLSAACDPCSSGHVSVIAASEFVDPLSCREQSLTCRCEPMPDLSRGEPGIGSQLVNLPGDPLLLSYDGIYGDLVLSRFTLDLTARADRALDGVPDEPPTRAIDGYRGGVAALGPDRGRHVAMAIADDKDGVVVDLVYQDATSQTLRYMRLRPLTGEVIARSVVPVLGDVGYANCLSYDPDDGSLVGMTYVRRDPQDRVSQLVAFKALGPAPSDEGDWLNLGPVVTRELPPSESSPCDDTCGPFSLCVRPSDGPDRCVSALDVLACTSPCAPHAVCVAAENDDELPQCLPRVYRDSELNQVHLGAGTFVSCTASERTVWGAWYDADYGALWAAPRPWQAQAILVDGSVIRDGTDVGRHVRMGSSPSGVVTIAYQDAISGDLKLAEWEAQAQFFQLSVAQQGLLSVGQRRVGLWPSLTFDLMGQPLIAHVDATRANVLLSRRDQSGCWKTNELFSSGAYVYPSLGRLDSTEALISVVKVGFDAEHRSAHTLMAARVLLPRCE